MGSTSTRLRLVSCKLCVSVISLQMSMRRVYQGHCFCCLLFPPMYVCRCMKPLHQICKMPISDCYWQSHFPRIIGASFSQKKWFLWKLLPPGFSVIKLQFLWNTSINIVCDRLLTDISCHHLGKRLSVNSGAPIFIGKSFDNLSFLEPFFCRAVLYAQHSRTTALRSQ